jgi:hypothetical protein
LELGSTESRAGVFFRYREGVYDGVFTHEFHLLELLPAPEWMVTSRVLEWSYVVSRRTSAGDKVERKLWASTAVGRAAEGRLQITLGVDGFPGMMWKGMPLPEKNWTLTAEGRRKSQISRSRLPTDYLGSLGVVASNGSAAFYRPELLYHEPR